jgi:hypothetical protein
MNTKLFLITALALSSILYSCKKRGCTDSDALNVDYEANENDGSCEYIIDKIIGTWNCLDVWNKYGSCGSGNGSESYSVLISQPSIDKFTITLENFAGLGYNDKVFLTYSNYWGSYISCNYCNLYKDTNNNFWNINSLYGTLHSQNYIQLSYNITFNNCTYSGTMTLTK